MTLLWFIAGASLVVALVAWRQARRTAKRLAQLSEMYWELKYQQGELRVQRAARWKASRRPRPSQAASRAAGRIVRAPHLPQALTLRAGRSYRKEFSVCQLPTMSS